jgi:hypothetical protein
MISGSLFYYCKYRFITGQVKWFWNGHERFEYISPNVEAEKKVTQMGRNINKNKIRAQFLRYTILEPTERWNCDQQTWEPSA